MSDVAIHTAPGWWTHLIHGVCFDCGWHGPVRDVYEPLGKAKAQIDVSDHRRDCPHAGVRA